jgi:hypothetical protein
LQQFQLHTFDVGHDFPIGEPHRAKSTRLLQRMIAPQVLLAVMRVAVNFDDQSFGRTKEIDDAKANDRLPAKFVSGQTAVAQRHP